ncbi:MAG: type III ribulose-bisphosphate carboxylase [Candidatus Aenigmarchaeota archaeon]|nr:type III ribulose-bisphosphate carboxylase [Candidatus Aenigmarchaeota archaeon]
MRYEDFIDTGYSPRSTDLVCEFHVEPLGISMRHAAGGVAAESSVGTWTDIRTMHKYVERLAAKVFSLRGNTARIAYPMELFEPGNMPNILSSVAGNVFGLKELRNLRLNDIWLPRKLARSFRGPRYGIAGVRRITGVKNRPLIGTIIKPKLGLRTADHAAVAYDAWAGGCDVVKDDENLASQSFNRFRQRVQATLRARDRAEKETGERKMYMANVTAETGEMLKRAKFLADAGNEYAMVDVLTTGFSGLQTLREENLPLVLHGHRAMHAALTKNRRHGISMAVLAKLLRIVGIDQLHVGTAVGKMEETEADVGENLRASKAAMHGIKPMMPVASGGLHPGMIPAEYRLFGKDVIIQMGGGIHGHPFGTRAGAAAARQAVDATMRRIPLRAYARTHAELRHALKHWG